MSPTALRELLDRLITAMVDGRITLDEGRRISPVLDDTDIREQFASVAFRAPVAEARTFWHALYDMDESSVELSFFVRDESGESIYTEPARLRVGA